MAFHPSDYPVFNSSCVMLPPLRNLAKQAHPTITLSDCSDLSNTTRDDTSPVPLPAPAIFPSPTAAPAPPSASASANTPVYPIMHHNSPPSIIMPSSDTPPRIPSKKLRRLVRPAATKQPPSHSHAQSPTAMPSAPAATLFKPRKKVRSSKSNIPGKSRYWTPSEHKLFVQALLKYGPKDLKAISASVGTRDMTQCRTHEQKCFMRLMRAAQSETMQRQEPMLDDGLRMQMKMQEKKTKQQKDVYSVPSSCGITLLCVVLEEMSRALQS